MKPLDKGHIGDNINSAMVSCVESSSQRFKMWNLESIFAEVNYIVSRLYFGGSIIGGCTSTVLCVYKATVYEIQCRISF